MTTSKIEMNRAAWHEAGHCLIADHYGMPEWTAFIQRTPERKRHEKMWIGGAWQGVIGRLTAFQSSVFAWAGPIAEYLADNVDFGEWSGATLDDFNNFYDESEQSATDLEKIAGHPQQTRTRKMAFQIVIEKRVRLRQMAEALKRDGRIDGWKMGGRKVL